MSRVVMLGGSGFIGRFVCRSLAGRGREVVVVDPRRPAEEVGGWSGADARDPEVVKAIVSPGDVVFHLVHTSVPAESMADPAAEQRENVDPFAALVEELFKLDLGGFVYSSSGGQVYGEALSLPISEDHPLNPESEYGKAKKSMEQIATEAADRHDVACLIVRIANPYGPWQELTNRHGVVPHLIRAATRGNPFTLYGGGVTVRDYAYIEDVAESVARLIERGARGRPVNIGTGIGVSLKELIGMVEKVTGKQIKIEDAPIRSSDVRENFLDVSRLEALTGYKPATPLAQGLEATLEHMRRYEKNS